MFRLAAALRSVAPVVKRSTGIVGLDVVPNAKEVLIKLYEKTLRDIKVCCRCLRELSQVALASRNHHVRRLCLMGCHTEAKWKS
jgi:hypothetical protein